MIIALITLDSPLLQQFAVALAHCCSVLVSTTGQVSVVVATTDLGTTCEAARHALAPHPL